MKYEHIVYYKNTPNGFAYIDDELSSTKELTDDEALSWINYLEVFCGLKRRDTKSTFFYTNVWDSTHFSEYIFHKGGAR